MLPFVFERGKSEGMNVVYHFTFRGAEEIKATVIIRDKTLQVLEGHSCAFVLDPSGRAG